MTARAITFRIFRHAVLFSGAIVMLAPFVWMVSTSLKPPHEIFGDSLTLLPQSWAADRNYGAAFGQVPLLRYLLNGIVVCGAIFTLQALIALPCAYALAKLRFRGRNLLFALVIVGLMIPGQAPVIPLYLMMWQAGLLDTYSACVIPHICSVFGIFLMRQFFRTVPDELIDAARLDGLGELAIVWRIMMPTAVPALLSFGIFSLVWNWNDYLWPLIVIRTRDLATPPLGVVFFRSEEAGSDWGPLMAGTVVITAPLVVAFLLAQRRFIEGITLTGVKGWIDQKGMVMRKLVFASVFALVGDLAGGADAQPVEIRVQYAQPGLFKETFDEITRQFMAANPDVRVTLLAPPPGYPEILAAHLRDALTGQNPEVGCHGMFNQRVLADRGLAQPLDPFIAQDANWRGYGFSEAALSLGRVSGRQVGLGFSMSMPTIYYNAAMVRAAGGNPDQFPNTWDEIIDLARRMHNPAERRTGMFLTWQVVGNWMWQALVSSYGGNQLTPDERRVAFDQEPGQRAIALLARLVNEANMPHSNYPATSQDFFGGRLGILIDSSAQLGNIVRTVGQGFEVRTAPMPLPGGDQARLPVGGMACVMLARDPAKQRAAWRYMTFASGPQGATIMVRNTGYVPLTDVPRNTPEMLGNYYRDNPNHLVTLQQMRVARDWYAFPGANGARINDVVRDHLQTVVNKSQQPDAVLRQMTADVQALLPR